jgi:iron complex outermembrane recepter protein
MLKPLMVKSTLAAFVCSVSFAAHAFADESKRIDVPAGELVAALEMLSRQAAVDLVFQPEQLKSFRTGGVTGTYSPPDAIRILLQGTPFQLHTDASSGAMVIAPPPSIQRSTAIDSPSSKTQAPRRSFWSRLRLAQTDVPPSSKGAGSGEVPASNSDPRETIGLEEIIVTATKRAQPLRDIPLSVTAITAQDIQERGYTNYADFLNAVPGVFFQDLGPGISQIQIRGLAAAEGGVASAVATYFGETVTNVLTNGGGKPNLRLVDIERVEVLRGPQGTLFGANSLSGVVRVIPRAPELNEFQAEVGTRGFTTAHSDDASYHLEGVVNFPLVQDRLALRLVGYEDDVGGYIDNVVPARDPVDYSFIADILRGQPIGTAPAGTLVAPGNAAFTRKDINSEDTWGARAALRWQATDRLRLDLTHAVQDVQIGSEVFTEPQTGRYNQQRALDQFEQGGQGERLQVSALVVNYDWDAVSLLSATNWVEMKRATNQDIGFLVEANFGAELPWPLREDSQGELFTQEIRVSSKGEGPFQWIAGAFYLQQDARYSQFVADYSCPGACLPDVQLGQDFALNVPPHKLSEQEQFSVFGEVSYEIAPRWTAGMGVRYLEEDLTSFFEPYFGLLADLFTGVAGETSSVTGSVSETNPSAYVRYEPTQDMTVYLQAARGFRSGSTNQALPDQCQEEARALGLGALTNPDTLWNYELGFKSLFADGRWGINSAIYKHKWKGVQLGVSLNCGFGSGFNGGDVDGEGIELELLGRAGRSWRFNLSVSYVHNEFERINSPLVGIAVGERVAQAPEKNGSAGVQYDFILGGPWTAFARADIVYMGDIPFTFGPGVTVEQDSFTTGSLRLGGQRDNLAVELFAKNVTDERAAVVSGDPDRGGRQYLLRPREIGIELRYSYK